MNPYRNLLLTALSIALLAPGALAGPTDAPPALPVGWREIRLAFVDLPLATPSAAQGDVGVSGRPDPSDPNNYEISIRVGQLVTPSPFVRTGGNVPAFATPPITLPAYTARANVEVSYRYDPATLECIIGENGQCVAIKAPVDIGQPDESLSWALGPGQQAELIVKIEYQAQTIQPNPQTVYVRVPLLGQVLSTL